MTCPRWAALIACIAAGVQLACASALSRSAPDKNRYVPSIERPLPDVSATAAAPVVDGVLRVERVSVAPLFERKGFVYSLREGYRSDFYNEFHTTPGVLIHDLLVDWLDRAHLARDVIGGGAMLASDWLLRLHVEQLYIDVRSAATPRLRLDLILHLRDAHAPTGQPVLTRRYALEQPVELGAPEALARGWDRLFGDVMRRIEDDLRRYFASHQENLQAAERALPKPIPAP